MKIGFLLGSATISGGTNVIYEHGFHLQQFGCQVFMITGEPVTEAEYGWHRHAGSFTWLTLEEAKKENFDLVFATWWQSPFLLPELSSRQYAYFVQSIESRFFDAVDSKHHDKRELDIWSRYCERTYSLKVPVITEARWIQNYLFENYATSAILVRNGISKELYRDPDEVIAPREPGKLRVLVEGPIDVGFKNVPTSIELCREAGVDEVWLLTSSDIDSYPGVDRVFSRVPIHETPAIYRSCDVLVKLSYIEGMFGPPLEMFHCGGTAIVYDVTGHDEYIVHEHNSYVVRRDDNEQVVAYLRQLQQNPATLQRLKEGAIKIANQWPDWQDAARLFYEAVQEIMATPLVSRTSVRRWAEECNAANNAYLAEREYHQFQHREAQALEPAEDNFIQLYYWAEQDGIDGNRYAWAHYETGTPVEITQTIPFSGAPFWIRLDPSVRVGVIEIFSIMVRSVKTGELLLCIDTAQAFVQLQVAGTLRRVGIGNGMTFFSYGSDPQLILPAITGSEIGEELVVTVFLQESSTRALLNRKENEGHSGGVKTKLKAIMKKARAALFSIATGE